MSSVPNTTFFSLQDVVNVTGGNSLSSAFSNANASFFDPAYNNDSYAPAQSLKRFRNYGSPDYVAFDWYTGLPATIKANGSVQYGTSGYSIDNPRCFTYCNDTKWGYCASADGILRIHDFSQSSIPIIYTYNLSVGTSLLFVKILGNYLFVGNSLGRVFMAPSRYTPLFHEVIYTDAGSITDMSLFGSYIYATNDSGRIFKYVPSTVLLPLFNDTFTRILLTSISHEWIAANNVYIFSGSRNGPETDIGNINNDNWSQSNIYWPNNPSYGSIYGVSDGNKVYLLHYAGEAQAWVIPEWSTTAQQIIFTGHNVNYPLHTVSSANGYVSFIYRDSFEISGDGGAYWSKVSFESNLSGPYFIFINPY